MKKTYGWMVGLTLLSFVTVGVFLSIAPDQIPVHYNAAGEIDRWGSKYEHLLFPFFTTLMGAFMGFMARFEGKKGRDMNAKVVAILGIWVLILFNAMWLFFNWKALQGTNLSDGTFGGKLLLILTMGSLIPVGNIMPRVSRNSAMGLRTKWSMADDVCWQKSQRFGGYLIVGTGIAGVALVSILPELWAGYAVLALLAVMIVGSILGSYRIYQKEMHKKV